MYSTETGAALIAIARHAIETRLGLSPAPPPELPRAAPRASFVTLNRDGELRGCIGSLEATRPLAEDVAVNACHAAFDDRRFPSVNADEWPAIRVEVSVLGEIEWRDCCTLAEAIDWVRAGADGAIIVSDGRRATFLPQVWETLSEPVVFFDHLLRKAGLWHWPADARVGRYPVLKYREAAEEGVS